MHSQAKKISHYRQHIHGSSEKINVATLGSTMEMNKIYENIYPTVYSLSNYGLQPYRSTVITNESNIQGAMNLPNHGDYQYLLLVLEHI